MTLRSAAAPIPFFTRLPSLMLAAGLLAGGVIEGRGQSIPVTNPSFETPDIVFAGPDTPTGWQRQEPNAMNPQVGIFDNPSSTSSAGDHIANADGGQVAFIFGGPNIGLFQDLTSTFQVGKGYTFTLGVGGGGGGMPYGTTLELRFYYRDGSNSRITIAAATRQIVFDAALDAADPQPINTLFDYTATLPTVQAGSAWAGKAIGIEVGGAPNVSTGSGYWDVDKARVATVPEPTAGALLLVAGALASQRRRRQTA